MYSNKKEFEFRVIWRKKNPEILFPFEELEKKNKWKQKTPNLSCGWRSRYTAHIRIDYSLTEQRAFGSGSPGWKRETAWKTHSYRRAQQPLTAASLWYSKAVSEGSRLSNHRDLSTAALTSLASQPTLIPAWYLQRKCCAWEHVSCYHSRDVWGTWE